MFVSVYYPQQITLVLKEFNFQIYGAEDKLGNRFSLK